MLPQAAERLDTRREIWPDEVRIRVERLNLDAASLPPARATQARRRRRRGPRRGARDRREPRQDAEPGHRLGRHAHRHGRGGRPGVAARPEPWATGWPRWSRSTLTPLVITDGLAGWDGRVRAGAGRRLRDPVRPLDRRRAPRGPRRRARAGGDGRLRCARADRPGRARSYARAPVGRGGRRGRQVRLAVAGRGPRSGRPSRSASCRPTREADLLREAGLADHVASPTPATRSRCADAVQPGAGGAGRRHRGLRRRPGLRARRDPGHAPTAARSIFFSMATSFAAAALGAEGLAADVTMLVGNGYVPGPRRLRARAAAGLRWCAEALRASALSARMTR